MKDKSKITWDPIILEPDLREIMAQVRDAKEAEAVWTRQVIEREEFLERMKHDPLRCGYRPPIWSVCDALFAFPWSDQEYGKAMRKHLGFSHPVKTVFILGAWGSGKTEYAGSAAQASLYNYADSAAWIFHMNGKQSDKVHQSLMYRYLLPEHKKKVLSEIHKISWSKKDGFTGNAYVLPNASEADFRNYEMDRESACESGKAKFVWCDEQVRADWLDSLGTRASRADGVVCVTFTPSRGYTPTVAMALDCATMVKDIPAFLLPIDGKDPDPYRYLGFNGKEHWQKATARGMTTIPQDCRAWLNGQSGGPDVPEGREFERMPRIMKSADGQTAIVFFNSADNPYSNPIAQWERYQNNPLEFKRRIFYGCASKGVTAALGGFDDSKHVIHPEPDGSYKLPPGTIYQIMDPAPVRNSVMLWILCTEDGRHIVVKEWPGNYHIPGVGTPGPWVEPGSDKKHKFDGLPGEGQKSFNWSLIDYKREIARIEGWNQYRADATDEEVELWVDTQSGKHLRTMDRLIDPRAADTGFRTRSRQTSLKQDLDSIGLYYRPAPGKDTDSGIIKLEHAINNNLFYVLSECTNTRLCIRIWTNADGKHGASKDIIDCLRYYILSGPVHLGSAQLESRGGGYF